MKNLFANLCITAAMFAIACVAITVFWAVIGIANVCRFVVKTAKASVRFRILLCAAALTRSEVVGHGGQREVGTAFFACRTDTLFIVHETPDGELLDRIAIVESRGRHNAIGAAGERGAYQIDHAAWLDVSSDRRRIGLPVFDWEFGAHHPRISRDYAGRYIELLRRRLTSGLRRPPTDAEVYASYNLGFGGFQRRGFNLDKCPRRTRDVARAIEKGALGMATPSLPPAPTVREKTADDQWAIEMAKQKRSRRATAREENRRRSMEGQR